MLNAIELRVRRRLAHRAGRPQARGGVARLRRGAAARITLAFEAAPGPGWTLHIWRSAGTINDKLRGFYRSTYTDDDGREHVIATTQMQATDARRAFPCWDEPDFKAVFGITLVVAEDLLAVSNGPEIERDADAATAAIARARSPTR